MNRTFKYPVLSSRLHSLFLCLLLLGFGRAGGAVEIRDYYITVDQQAFEEILANPDSNIYVDCAFEFNGGIWPDARIRLRGESSREYPKKSYKINFDADNRFGERDKLNLISCWTDPSFAREHLCYDLYQRAGLIASRTWYARFFVNGVYYGLYLDIEQVDEHFLRYTDLPDDGSLYKADDAGSLISMTENLEAVWNKNTNEDTGFDELVELREWIDSHAANSFHKTLHDVFDPAQLARAIAINAFVGNQSTYYHNYYLVHDVAGSGQWTYLPWDMDNSFIFWDDFRSPPYYRSGHQSDYRTNPLISKCWTSPGMRELIFEEMNDLSDELLEGSYYENYLNELRDDLYPAVVADTFKQFSDQLFLDDIGTLASIIEARRAAVMNQINEEIAPFLLKRSLLTGEGAFLHWSSAQVPDCPPVTYEIWISDNVWFSGDVQVVSGLEKPFYLIPAPPEGNQFFRVYASAAGIAPMQSISYYEWVVNELPFAEGQLLTEPVTTSVTLDAAPTPYLLPAGLTVEENGSLNLVPGTILKIGAEQDITVYGSISLVGTAQDSIRVEPLEETHYWGMLLVDEPAEPLEIAYTSMRGGGATISDTEEPSMIDFTLGTLYVHHSTFRDTYRGSSVIACWNSDLTIDYIDLEVPLESFFGDLSWPDALLTYGSSQSVTNSRFAKTPGARFGGDLLDFASTANTFIKNCLLENPGDDAIDFDYAYGAIIDGNTIRGAQDNAMSLGFCENFQIFNNVITDCASGIYAKDESELTLYNNVIAFTSLGLRLNRERPPQSVVVRNCVFQSNTTSIDLDEQQVIDVQYSAFSGDAAYPGEHNIAGDLRFTSIIDRDFRLRSTSPLIDAGWGTGSPPHDRRDTLRTDNPDVENRGGGDPDYVDIGAFEYVSSDPPPPNPEVPVSFMFVDNFPNPFNSWTTIRFSIVRSGPVELVIFDRLGRRVFGNTWYGLAEGTHYALWDGFSKEGIPLASGLYFMRLKQAAGYISGKMVLLR